MIMAVCIPAGTDIPIRGYLKIYGIIREGRQGQGGTTALRQYGTIALRHYGTTAL